MTTLYIDKKDNVHARLTCDDAGFLMSLYEHFSRFVDGYIFSPQYKNRIWDGKIHFYNRMTREIYLGLVNRVIDYAKQEGIKVKLDPEIITSFSDASITKQDVYNYLDALQASNGKGDLLEQRDYQRDAVATIVMRKRRMIASPTSSGKSFIIYSACRYLLEHELKRNEQILIVVPTIGLIKQMKSDMIEYSLINKWAAYDHITEYGGGKKNDTGRIVVATWQSLYKKPQEFFDRFRVLMVDEAHQAKAKSLVEIGKMCVNAEYRIGLSGSFEQDETTEMTLNGLFANRTVTITTRDMIDKGYAAQLEIECIQLKHDEMPSGKLDWQTEIEYLITNKRRNEFIINLADGLKGNTLILFERVEKHGLPLYELAKKLSDKKIYIIYGKVDVDEREEIRKILEKEKDAILLASYKTFATGSNVKNLENIVFASPTKSFTRVIQSIGRGLRQNVGKVKCTLYDIFDYLCGDRKNIKTCNHTFYHFSERVKIYGYEKHPYNVNNAQF